MELAKRSGVPQGTISNIETGDTKQPAPDALEALARALGVPVTDLMASPASSRSLREELAQYLERVPYEVPVYEQEAAAAMFEGAEPLTYVPIPADVRPVKRDLFALTVRGDSLAPDVMPGDYVVIDPDRSPANGDLVAANADAKVMLKRYEVSDGKARLAGNGGPVDAERVEIIGVVVWQGRRR